MLRIEMTEKGKGIEIAGIFVPEETVKKANIFSDDAEEASYTDVHLELEADAKKLISEQYPAYADNSYDTDVILEMSEKSALIVQEELAYADSLGDSKDHIAVMALYGAVYDAICALQRAKWEIAKEHKDKKVKGPGIEIAGIHIPEEIAHKADVPSKNADAASYIGAQHILKADATKLISEQYPEYASDYYEPSMIGEMFDKIKLIRQEKHAYIEALYDPKHRVAAITLYDAVYSAMWSLLDEKLTLADDEEPYEDD